MSNRDRPVTSNTIAFGLFKFFVLWPAALLALFVIACLISGPAPQ